MKQNSRTIKQIFLLTAFIVCFILLTIDAAAITTPWIDVKEDTETGESGEPLTGEDDLSAETGESSDIAFDFGGNGETNTETEAVSERSVETPKKKGCGSMILPNGVGAIFIIGIIELFFLMRKGKHDESAN